MSNTTETTTGQSFEPVGVILFDLQLMRPACAFLQKFYGLPEYAAHLFPQSIWLWEITGSMRPMAVTLSELKQLIEKTA